MSISTSLIRPDFGWLTGDLIAGITVGIVLVPQSMSYAQVNTTPPHFFITHNLSTQLATLPAQYGLYSSFVGVLIYCVRTPFQK